MGQPGHVDGWQKWITGAGEFVQHRLAGDHEGGEAGFDPEFHASVFMPLFRPLYRKWFRVQMRGLENVPGTGAALVVANHSGVLPFDKLEMEKKRNGNKKTGEREEETDGGNNLNEVDK